MTSQTNRIVGVGQLVPSSNTTMETEIPAMLRAREAIAAERFTFHSSRMRMKRVVKEELEAMDRDSDRCALELSDARVDVLGYACLVAIKFKAVNNRDRNFTDAKIKRRMEQIEQSIERYLAAMDTADRTQSEVAEPKAVRLKHRIEKLKQQMQGLKEMDHRQASMPVLPEPR